MKNSNFKKILSTVLFVVLVVATVFAISSCDKHVHDLTCETVEATCTEDGLKTFTCKDPECDFKETEVVISTGHDLVNYAAKAANCTEAGHEAYVACSKCDYVTTDIVEIPATGHTAGKVEIKNEVKPTCVDRGSYDSVTYCADCDEVIKEQSFNVTAPGHVWENVDAKAATCTIGWYDYRECKTCGEREGYEEIAPKYDHIPSEHPVEIKNTRVNPTCTVDGHYMEAIVCTHDCGTVLSEATERVLPMLGHDIVEHDAKDPDCVKKGNEAYETCTRCDYTTYAEIPALGHTPLEAVEENRVEPDCVKKGSYEMASYCEVCDAEVSREKFDIVALDHDYVDHEGKANSCTEIGWNAYRTCTRCDYNEYVEIPAHGHDEVEGEIENFVEPDCTKEGSYDRVFYCSICEIELDRESWIVPAVAHNNLGVVDAKEPTCDEAGWEAYTCCSKCGYTESKVELPAIGHKEVKHDALAPTCTEIGHDAYVTCERCDYTTYVAKEAIGHNVVTLDAVAPGCETDGLTAGQYCTGCDALTVEQRIVEKLGHNYDANGLCGNCDNKISLGLDFVAVNGGYEFAGIGACEDKIVVIPAEINGVPVVSVAANAFKNSDIESVVIPASVETIGKDAFFSCTSLKSVVIEGSTAIGDYAFFGCGKLTSVTISGSVESIGVNAFGSCYRLATVYYDGTAAEWGAIAIASGNDKLLAATRYYI